MFGTIHIETGISDALPVNDTTRNDVQITVTEPNGDVKVTYESVTANATTLYGLNFTTVSVHNATNYVGAMILYNVPLSLFTSFGNRTYTLNANPPQSLTPISGLSAATPITPGVCYTITWVESGFTLYTIPAQPTNPLYFYYDVAIPFSPGNLNTQTASPGFGKKLSNTDGYVSNAAGVPAVPRPAYINFNGLDPYPAIPIVYSAVPCCIAEDTKLRTGRGILTAAEIVPGDWLYTEDGSGVQVRRNVRFDIPTRDFIQLGAAGGEFLIKGDHPILEDGVEILAKESKAAKEILLMTPKIVHTFITEKRDFVTISDIQVGTWSQEAFENFIEQDVRGQSMRFQYIH